MQAGSALQSSSSRSILASLSSSTLLVQFSLPMQSGSVAQSGSTQSILVSLSSSLELLQISLVIQAGSALQSSSAQSILASLSSSTLLVQFSVTPPPSPLIQPSITFSGRRDLPAIVKLIATGGEPWRFRRSEIWISVPPAGGAFRTLYSAIAREFLWMGSSAFSVRASTTAEIQPPPAFVCTHFGSVGTVQDSIFWFEVASNPPLKAFLASVPSVVALRTIRIVSSFETP